jgi:membrane protease YdiL (CAAX protease family)
VTHIGGHDGFRGKLRAVGLSAAFLIGGFALAAGLYGLGASVLYSAAPSLTEATLLQSAAALVAFGLATSLIGLRGARLTPTELRWVPGGPRHLGIGLGFGGGAALVAMVVAVPVAGAAWAPDGGTAGAWSGTVLALVGLLLPAAFVEELIFRGVPMVLLAQVFGRATAVVSLGVLFALAHVLNPGVTPLAVGNVALAGVFLGTTFYLPGGLWTATGAHLGWNMTLAALGAPVSGLPFAVPWLDYRPGGPAWLSGGPFGPEGGLTATLVLAVATIIAVRFTQKETVA